MSVLIKCACGSTEQTLENWEGQGIHHDFDECGLAIVHLLSECSVSSDSLSAKAIEAMFHDLQQEKARNKILCDEINSHHALKLQLEAEVKHYKDLFEETNLARIKSQVENKKYRERYGFLP